MVDRSASIDVCDYEAIRSWNYLMGREIDRLSLGDHALSQGRWIQFQSRWIRLRSMAGKEDKRSLPGIMKVSKAKLALLSPLGL